jgi:hypothetical protein
MATDTQSSARLFKFSRCCLYVLTVSGGMLCLKIYIAIWKRVLDASCVSWEKLQWVHASCVEAGHVCKLSFQHSK